MKNKLIKMIQLVKQLIQISDTLKRLNRRDAISRSLPGHPIQYNTHSLLLLYYVMIVKRIRSFRGLHVFLDENADVLKACGLRTCPSHQTLSKRFKTLAGELQIAIQNIGNLFISAGIVNPKYVAADSKLFWAPKYDKQARYGKGSKGWVKGYALSLVCVATPNNIPLPLLAKVHKNNEFAAKYLVSMIHDLPANTQFVLADSGYDFECVYRAVERFDTNGDVIRKAIISPRQGHHLTPARQRRLAFYNSPRGKKIFAHRLPSVESNFARFVKELHITHCFFSGLKLNRCFLLLCVFVYLALVYSNIILGSNHILAITHFLNTI